MSDPKHLDMRYRASRNFPCPTAAASAAAAGWPQSHRAKPVSGGCGLRAPRAYRDRPHIQCHDRWLTLVCGTFVAMMSKFESLAELTIGPLKVKMREVAQESRVLQAQLDVALKELAAAKAEAKFFLIGRRPTPSP